MLLLNKTICQSCIEWLCDGEMCKFNILCVGPGLDAWPGLTARTLYCWSAEWEQGRISPPPTSLWSVLAWKRLNNSPLLPALHLILHLTYFIQLPLHSLSLIGGFLILLWMKIPNLLAPTRPGGEGGHAGWWWGYFFLPVSCPNLPPCLGGCQAFA